MMLAPGDARKRPGSAVVVECLARLRHHHTATGSVHGIITIIIIIIIITIILIIVRLGAEPVTV
jgi:hypothetical protein